MIRLDGKGITEAVNRIYPSGTGTYQVNPADRAIAKAQLKKIVGWLIEEYGEFMYDENTGLRNDKPIFIRIDPDEAPWQALLEEIKE